MRFHSILTERTRLNDRAQRRGDRAAVTVTGRCITECVITTCKDHRADRPACSTQPLILSPGCILTRGQSACTYTAGKPLERLLLIPPPRPSLMVPVNNGCRYKSLKNLGRLHQAAHPASRPPQWPW